jgi:hypothetical protein
MIWKGSDMKYRTKRKGKEQCCMKHKAPRAENDKIDGKSRKIPNKYIASSQSPRVDVRGYIRVYLMFLSCFGCQETATRGHEL